MLHRCPTTGAKSCCRRPAQYCKCASLQVRADAAGRRVTVHQGERDIELLVPAAAASAGRGAPEQRPVVWLQLRHGRLKDADLPLVHHLMLLTNDARLQAKAGFASELAKLVCHLARLHAPQP